MLWLPEEVDERTPAGVLKRRVIFRKVRIVSDFPANFFRLEGGREKPWTDRPITAYPPAGENGASPNGGR